MWAWLLGRFDKTLKCFILRVWVSKRLYYVLISTSRPIYVVLHILLVLLITCVYVMLCGLCTAALAIRAHYRRVEVHGGFQLRDIPLILLIVVRLAERCEMRNTSRWGSKVNRFNRFICWHKLSHQLIYICVPVISLPDLLHCFQKLSISRPFWDDLIDQNLMIHSNTMICVFSL